MSSAADAPPSPASSQLRASRGGSRVVRLDVGGKRYVTTEATLLSHGDNYFTGLLSGKYSADVDDDGWLLIDRNGRLFEPILDFLRTGELSCAGHDQTAGAPPPPARPPHAPSRSDSRDEVLLHRRATLHRTQRRLYPRLALLGAPRSLPGAPCLCRRTPVRHSSSSERRRVPGRTRPSCARWPAWC